MTLIVETGDGLANANSYADVATADAFFADRNNTVWSAAATPAKEAALIRATDYIDSTYIFLSVPLTDTQALLNPRDGQTELHPVLIKATCECALLLLSNDPFAAVTQRDVIESTEKLDGVGETTTKYDTARNVTDPFPALTRLISRIAPSRRGADAGVIRLTR